jgi:hypothetical protein
MLTETEITAKSLEQELLREFKNFSAGTLLIAKKMLDEVKKDENSQSTFRLKELFHLACEADRLVALITRTIEETNIDTVKNTTPTLHLV